MYIILSPSSLFLQLFTWSVHFPNITANKIEIGKSFTCNHSSTGDNRSAVLISDLCPQEIYPWTHQRFLDPQGSQPSGGSSMKTPWCPLGSSWRRSPTAERVQKHNECKVSYIIRNELGISHRVITFALEAQKEGGMRLYGKCETSARGDASLSTTHASCFSSSHGTLSQLGMVWMGVRSPPFSTSGRISCIQIVPEEITVK